MADIKATVPFNQQSQTYEIQADSSFNVTCSYENVNASLTHAKVCLIIFMSYFVSL